MAHVGIEIHIVFVWKNGKCSKRFPKRQCAETRKMDDGHVEYRRRCRKKYPFPPNITNSKNYKAKYMVSDEDVVPYSRYFLAKYRCHINLELLSFAEVVKYLFKYITKGEMRAKIELILKNDEGIYDEIKSYLLCQYISANEAFHHIFKDDLYDLSHKITSLALHKPGEQNVVFQEGNEAETIEKVEAKMTQLQAFFALNDPSSMFYDENAADLLYMQIPQYYTWTDNRWKLRKNKGWGEKNLSRLPYNYYIDKEHFALRILLLNVKGPSSFEFLKSFNGTLYKTFHEAGLARGLINDTEQIRIYIQEAIAVDMGYQLRLMFAILICNIVDFSAETIGQLWEEYRDYFCDDYIHRLESTVADVVERKKMAYGYGLIDMERLIKQCSAPMTNKKVGLPKPPDLPPFEKVDQTIIKAQHQKMRIEMYAKIQSNKEQKKFVDDVMSAINSKSPQQRLFVLLASGGTGKSFCLNYLIHALRSEYNDNVIAVAFTGIAALLLNGGKTAHSQFRIKDDNCDVKGTDRLAKRINRCKLIIFDEISMVSNKILEKVDKMLRDIAIERNNRYRVFGGKIVVFAGDLRQMLPVIVNADKYDILAECVTQWSHWGDFKRYSLTKNMRLDENEINYQNWLLKLGDGKVEAAPNCYEYEIKIDAKYVVPKDSLVQHIFNEEFFHSTDTDILSNSVILTPTNEEAMKINNEILSKIDSTGQMYLSIDTIISLGNIYEDGDSSLPTELLNKLTPNGFPPHQLILKKNCIVMIIRNLNIDEGLVNGTRLIVQELYPRSVKCQILNGT